MNIIKRLLHWVSLKIQAMLAKHQYERLISLRGSFLTDLLRKLKTESSFPHEARNLWGYFDDCEVVDGKIYFQIMDYRFVIDAKITSKEKNSIIYRTTEIIYQLGRAKSQLEPDYKRIPDLDVYYETKGYFSMKDEPLNTSGKFDLNLFDEYCKRLVSYVDSIETEDSKDAVWGMAV